MTQVILNIPPKMVRASIACVRFFACMTIDIGEASSCSANHGVITGMSCPALNPVIAKNDWENG